MSSLSQSVICEEIFDDTSHPSVSEVRDYASKIGIDPDSEPQLLPLAEEGLMKPLPLGWKPCLDDNRKAYYYHNNLTGKTQWEHPLDGIYRELVVKARAESQSLSLGEPTEDATYTRDDLPSYEEPPALPRFSKTKKDVKLSPLKTQPQLNTLDSDINCHTQTKLLKQKSEERPHTAALNRKINLSLFSSFDEKSPTYGNVQNSQKHELTLKGGGSMFLKTNTKKENDSSPSISLNPLRSILRENPTDKVEKEEDDKKSVRFNVETNPDRSYIISDDSETEESSDKPEIENIINVKIINKNVKPKSRFTVLPVMEPLQNVQETSNPLNKNTSRNLKLVKPDPTDFLKPELESDEIRKVTNLLTDSEDEFVVNDDKSDQPNTINFSNKEIIIHSKSPFDLTQKSNKVYDEVEVNIDDEELLNKEKTKQEVTMKKQLENLSKEFENKLNAAFAEEKSRLESQLEKQKLELKENLILEEQKFKKSLEEEFDKKTKLLEDFYKEKSEQIQRELEEKLEKSRDELTVSHNAILDSIKQKHSAVINELQLDFKAEEDIIRREHQKQISELKNKVTREVDIEKLRTNNTEDERLYEKVRCEKRLLEDKYRCLKDKYLKLKTDVKLSIEKRNRRREQNLTNTTTTTTTGSETERSPSGIKDRTPIHSPSTNRKSSPKYARSHHEINKHKSKLDYKYRTFVSQEQDTSASDHSFKNEDKYNQNDSQREYDSSDLDLKQGRSRRKLFSRVKSSSASRINNNPKSKESQRSCSPVENLRKQLQKLEDLEDQFPQNAQGDTYHLRYPFSDGQRFEGSSELEFFRHRIHLERDSIRRAKESLRKQKTTFKQRQSELRLKHGSAARNTLKQLYQEERELTDMEVSLHRTRSLLGEKVIRLRHLEQSLQRATVTNDDQQKQDDATLSDLSSHSASSGISSTEFAMADSPATKNAQFKESSEIIQSLENLNSEIREIWDVLNKQHQSSNFTRVLPPLPLLYPDFGWPLLTGAAPVPPSIPTLADRLQNYRQQAALANAQSTMVTHDTQGATTTLVEKTRHLRQWLRQTGTDATVDASAQQATL